MIQQIIGTNQYNIEPVNLYVKRVFTTTTKTYCINANAPLREIMEYILNNSEEHFQLEGNIVKELVVAGQYIPGIKSEDFPAIELDNPDETFKQRFHNSYKSMSLYIRKARNVAG